MAHNRIATSSPPKIAFFLRSQVKALGHPLLEHSHSLAGLGKQHKSAYRSKRGSPFDMS